MAPNRQIALAAAAIVTLADACGGGATPSPTASLSPTREPTPTAATIVPSPTASPSTTPTPAPEPLRVAATAWLVDVATGETTTLLEDFDNAPYRVDFGAEGEVVARYTGVDARIAFDGTELGDAPRATGCEQLDGAVTVGGVRYDGARCGRLSPDGRWMTYAVTIDDRTLAWDQWLLDLRSGERRLLQTGLRHAAGDFFFGPAWSPTGRYLSFSEYAGGRVFLAGVEAGAARLLSSDERGSRRDRRPVWAPDSNVLLRPGEGDAVLVEDLDAGTVEQLRELSWPATFDPSSRYIYSPAWDTDGPDGPPSETVVVDSVSGAVVARLAGEPSDALLWIPGQPVAFTPSGPVAALVNAAGCAGVAVHAPSLPAALCVEGAARGQASPDGSRVALSRRTGTTGPVETPFGSSSRMLVFEIVMVDAATGIETIAATGALSFHAPPRLVWHSGSALLLVQSPGPEAGL